MLNEDYREMLQELTAGKVKYLLVGVYDLADAEALESLLHKPE